MLQQPAQITDSRDDQRADERRGKENPAAEAEPDQRNKDGKRRHGFEQISAGTLTRETEHQKEDQHPPPEIDFVVAQIVATEQAPDRQGHDGQHNDSEQTSIQGIAGGQHPDTAVAPEHFGEIARTVWVKLAGVFANHEFLPDRLWVRIEHEPECEDAQRQQPDKDQLIKVAP